MNDYTGPELCALGANRLVDLLRKGEISSGDLIDASLARIKQVNGHVNAVVTLCEDRARAASNDGMLSGLPVGIKDLTAVAGVRTTYGTPRLADFVPECSDPLVQQLETSGGVVLAKTNTPEMGAGAVTFNEVFGWTRNPYDLDRNCGGSSGGSAVALATGCFALASGSDYGGSLRTPAAFNGVVGLRPSPGRCGAMPFKFDIGGVEGPMARTVTDCALFLDALSGPVARSPIALDAPKESFLSAVSRDLTPPRIAWSPTLGGFGTVEQDVLELLEGALRSASRSGAVVDDTSQSYEGLDHAFRVMRGISMATGTGTLPEDVQARFKDTLRENIAYGRALTGTEILSMMAARASILETYLTTLRDFDVLACPVVGLPPGPIGEEYPSEVAGKPMQDYIEWLRFAFLATVTSSPAISLPVGYLPNGLPMGLQLIGKPRGEAELLRNARWLEAVLDLDLAPKDPIMQGGDKVTPK